MNADKTSVFIGVYRRLSAFIGGHSCFGLFQQPRSLAGNSFTASDGRGSDAKSRNVNEAIRATTVREWWLRRNANLRLRALGFDVEHFDRAVGEIARDAPGVRQPPGLSGFEFDILRLAVRHGETNAAPGDADEHAGAVVMQRYRFAGAQRQTQDSRAIVFEVHANVGGGDTDDVARQFFLGNDIGGHVAPREFAALELRGQR